MCNYATYIVLALAVSSTIASVSGSQLCEGIIEIETNLDLDFFRSSALKRNDLQNGASIFFTSEIIKQSLPSPEEGPVILKFNDGDIFELDITSSGQDSLSLILEMDVDKDGNIEGNLAPVGRSYNGNPWEAYANEFSTSVSFDCEGSSSCRAALPYPQAGRAYVLKSNQYSHDLSQDDLNARFLEKTTFGPTKTEINAFSSPGDWMEEQFNLNMTSHRQFYRERVSQWHYETNSMGLLNTGPCNQSAKYRRYAILSADDNRFVEVTESPYDPTKLILSVDGLVRTIVDGPFQYGYSTEILGNVTLESFGKYEICKYPFEGVGGRLLFKGDGIPTNGQDGCYEVRKMDAFFVFVFLSNPV